MKQDQDLIPDEILVVSAILGDLPAFDELVRRYRSAVLRMARNIVGMPQAEDVAQDVWLLAFKALPSIDDPQKFGAWLMVITRNRANRVYSREKKRADNLVAMDAFLLEQLTSLQKKSHPVEETHEALLLALDGIPDEYGLALKMRFFDMMPLKRIASFLDVPLSTIKWRVFRGKQLIKEKIAAIEGPNGYG